jgi:hypothetical protein
MSVCVYDECCLSGGVYGVKKFLIYVCYDGVKKFLICV